MSQPLKNEKVASGGSLTELKPEIEQEAREFLSETLGRQITGDFGTILKDGTLLCEFINKLSPKANVKINKQKAPFLQMENIGSYLTACKNLGVTSEYLFMTVDLYEQKNLAIVALNIIAVKRQLGFGFQRTKSIQGGVFDYTVDQNTAPEKAPSIKDGGVKPQPSPPQQAPKQQQSHDQTPINISINFAHNQSNSAINATNQLNQKEPNKGKHDAVHMAVVKLGEINNDFRPNTNTSQTSRPSLTIVEDAIEKVIETLNNDGESIQGMKYDNKPQAHALSQSASTAQDAFSLKVDNVAAGIKAAADQYENQVAKDISEHLALIAKYAREGDKRGMINQSKESANRIGDLIKILRDYAGRIGKNAAEKQLQDRLIQCANSLQNNATHLKILVSVKAASSEQNKDTDESLTAIIAGIGAHISEGLNALRITEETVFKQKPGGK